MYELLVELGAEFGAVVGLGAVVTTLTGLGVLSELSGFHRVVVGNTLGFWFLFMGAIAFVAAYMLTVDELLPRLREIRAEQAHGPSSDG
jgi:hypothetical protein